MSDVDTFDVIAGIIGVPVWICFMIFVYVATLLWLPIHYGKRLFK